MVLIKENKHKVIKLLPEVLLDNRLEKDIQKMMYPVNLVLSFFLSSKYNLKDDYITPKGKIFYMLTMYLVVLVYGLGIHRLFFKQLTETMGTKNNQVVSISILLLLVFYCVGFTVIFILNFVHIDINISIILLIQKIYKALDFSGSLRKVTRWNWISMLSAFGINIFLEFWYYGIYNHFYFIDLVFDTLFITFDIHLVYAILVIVLLRKYLEKWIADVSVASDGFETFSKHYFGVYQNILEAYSLYKTIFQALILFHTTDRLLRSLSYFSIGLEILTIPETSNSEEEEIQSLLTSCVASIWLLKDISLVVIQCVQCEKFYATVEEAETTCIQRLKNKHYQDDEETLSSNIIQANRSSFSKMTACGLFYIDASLPLQLIAFLTNYIIIILQIYFL